MIEKYRRLCDHDCYDTLLLSHWMIDLLSRVVKLVHLFPAHRRWVMVFVNRLKGQSYINVDIQKNNALTI